MIIKRSLKIIMPLLAILFALPFHCSANQLRVARVTDGDTIKVVVDHMETVVRLVGIDAPELGRKKNEPGQPFSKSATQYLAKLVLKKTITIKEYGSDRYGRILAVVFVDGTNANLEMVKAGLAEVYRGKHARYFNPKIYQEAEEEAKKADRACGCRVINIFRQGIGGRCAETICDTWYIYAILASYKDSQCMCC